MSVLEQPCAIFLLLGTKQIKGFVQTTVGAISRVAEIVQPTQHVVVPASRKGKLQPRWIDDFASALTAKQLSFEEVLFGAASSGDGFGGASGCALVRQEAFQNANGAVERRAHGTPLGLAIPSAVFELLADEPGDDAIDI